LFDKDGSGSISIDEIKGIFGSDETAVSDEVWKELLAEVDANGDGSVFKIYLSLDKLLRVQRNYC